MPKRTAFVPLILLLTSCGWIPYSGAEDQVLPTLPDASLLDFSEQTNGDKVTAEASSLLQSRDYDGLEKAAAKYEASESSIGNGLTPNFFFFQGLECLANDESDTAYKERMDALNAWIQARPDSITAQVVLGKVMTDYAWFARGNGYANTVSDGGWQLFGERLQKARDILDKAAPKRQDCAIWYQAMATVALGQSWSHDEFFKMVDEKTSAKPAYMELQNQVIVYLLPRWYGSNQELKDYITQSADKLGGDDGDILYARLAKTIWSYTRETNVFTEVGLSWPRVKHGLELICNRYPHSANMMNYYCLFAYQSQNRAIAQFLFNHLNEQVDPRVWGNGDSFGNAKTWANGN